MEQMNEPQVTEQLCDFPPPHGQIRRLGLIKIDAQHRKAVATCPFDWSVPELEVPLTRQSYEGDRARIIRVRTGRSFVGINESAVISATMHPPNKIAYCEYHGGTRHQAAAGEWCALCEELRKIALEDMEFWQQQCSPQKRVAFLRGRTELLQGSQWNVEGKVFQMKVAIGVLGLFPEQKVRQVLWDELFFAVGVRRADYTETVIAALTKSDPDGVATFYHDILGNQESPLHDLAPLALRMVDKETLEKTSSRPPTTQRNK